MTRSRRFSGGKVGVGRFDTVVLDCANPRALATFYAGLLGQDIDDDGDDSWQSLSGDGTPLSPTTAPDPDQTSGFRVYADPAGHPFCLCR